MTITAMLDNRQITLEPSGPMRRS